MENSLTCATYTSKCGNIYYAETVRDLRSVKDAARIAEMMSRVENTDIYTLSRVMENMEFCRLDPNFRYINFASLEERLYGEYKIRFNKETKKVVIHKCRYIHDKYSGYELYDSGDYIDVFTKFQEGSDKYKFSLEKAGRKFGGLSLHDIFYAIYGNKYIECKIQLEETALGIDYSTDIGETTEEKFVVNNSKSSVEDANVEKAVIPMLVEVMKECKYQIIK